MSDANQTTKNNSKSVVENILDSLSGSEIKQLGKMLAKMGNGGDTILAHINPEEAALLKANGGSGKPNAKTGLPAFEGDGGDGGAGDGGAGDGGAAGGEGGAAGGEGAAGDGGSAAGDGGSAGGEGSSGAGDAGGGGDGGSSGGADGGGNLVDPLQTPLAPPAATPLVTPPTPFGTSEDARNARRAGARNGRTTRGDLMIAGGLGVGGLSGGSLTIPR